MMKEGGGAYRELERGSSCEEPLPTLYGGCYGDLGECLDGELCDGGEE